MDGATSHLRITNRWRRPSQANLFVDATVDCWQVSGPEVSGVDDAPESDFTPPADVAVRLSGGDKFEYSRHASPVFLFGGIAIRYDLPHAARSESAERPFASCGHNSHPVIIF